MEGMMKTALAGLLLAATSLTAYGADISGQNRNGSILSSTESQPPGLEGQGHIIKQVSQAFVVQNTSNPLFAGTAVEVAQQEVNGDKVAHHGFGRTRNNEGDTYIWTANGTGQLQNGQVVSGSGKWEIVNGTGKFARVRGSGQYNCKFGPDTINGCDWSGQIDGAPSM
jgi:hypothetical protein